MNKKTRENAIKVLIKNGTIIVSEQKDKFICLMNMGSAGPKYTQSGLIRNDAKSH